jgi:sugar phosphate isomerase/epimerase
MPFQDTRRLCIHTLTTRPLSFDDILGQYPAAGISSVTVWRQTLAGRSPSAAGQQLREAGLEIASICRGGFFPSHRQVERQQAVDENRRVIDEAAELGAPLVVLVCGADPDQSLVESRRQIQGGIAAILPHAAACGVKLAVEPLHPMYAGDRSAINTLAQANNLCQQLPSPWLGVVIDVYHLWWDPDLEQQIQRCGRNEKIFAFHISDWKLPVEDLLNDRGLMGEGCIPIREIRGWVEKAGFAGYIEVEIFSHRHWAKNQSQYLQEIKSAYLQQA